MNEVPKRFALVGLALVLFVFVVALSPDIAVLGVVLGVFVVLPLLTYLDAINIPLDSWNAAGRSRTGWTIAFFILPLGVSMVSTLAYWAWIRRRLPGGTLRSGDPVEITAGLDAGLQATLGSRTMLGFGGLWKATVLREDGVALEVQVTSSTVRRRSSSGAGTRGGGERASSQQLRRRGSIKRRIAALGLAAAATGGAVVAVGFSIEDELGVVVIVLGAAAIVLGLFQTAYCLVRFRNRRRLPRSLRAHASSTELVSLELRDGRRILAAGVLPGGYVLPRPTDPPFDAADATAVVAATADEVDEERRRRAGKF